MNTPHTFEEWKKAEILVALFNDKSAAENYWSLYKGSFSEEQKAWDAAIASQQVTMEELILEHDKFLIQLAEKEAEIERLKEKLKEGRSFKMLAENTKLKHQSKKLEDALMELYRWHYHVIPHDETEPTEYDQGYDRCLVNVKIFIEEVLGLDGE